MQKKGINWLARKEKTGTPRNTIVLLSTIDMVIYYKECIFGLSPISWQGAPKALGICCCQRDKDVFCYVNEVSFKKHLGWGLINSGTNLVITELSVPPTDLQGRGRNWRLSSVTVNDLISCADAIKPP